MQRPCVNCGDCVTGCNFSAKNTLYMNYLPMAAKNGADIFTQTKVEWIEKLSSGGWRIHGQHVTSAVAKESFTLDAGERDSRRRIAQLHRNPAPLGDARPLGLARARHEFQRQRRFLRAVLQRRLRRPTFSATGSVSRAPAGPAEPGPSIVGVVRYNGNGARGEAHRRRRFLVPERVYRRGARPPSRRFAATTRASATRTSSGSASSPISTRPQQYVRDGALNHTMLYLVMGQDDARGTMHFDAPWIEPDGRMTIEWDKAGQQILFTRMNEELRRHARAL